MRRALLLTPLWLAMISASDPALVVRPTTDEIVITGRVTDADSGAPVASTQVYLEGTAISTLSDVRGDYRLIAPTAAIPAGGARLIAQRIGYAAEHVVVRADAPIVRIDFRIRAVTLALDEIVVTNGDGAPVRTAPLAQLEAASVAGSAASPAASAPQPAPPAYGGFDREAYDYIAENAFLAAATNPLSTFSIDVDRASYSNVRRFLRQGRLPPKDAVRIEEMVNYFRYDYPTPDGPHPIAVATELSAAPWRPEHHLLRISIASEPIDTRSLPPSNLVFLIDVSGSMAPPNKLPLVKRSLRMLVEELRPRDRVAIVVYAGAAGLVLPSTPGSEKERIMAAIENLEAGGSTAGGAGLRLAYRVAAENHLRGGNNRVILASDGDFNVGESSDAAMIRLVEEMREQDTFLTVLGFGMGNLQDAKMQKLAQHGNGNYAYIDSLLEARKVLVAEMGGTLHTVAKDVKLQVEFNPARVAAYRLIGYENRLLAAEDFNDDAKDAGELGAGHTVTALYEIAPVGPETGVEVRGVDPLRYQNASATTSMAGSDELALVRARYKNPDGVNSRLLEHVVVDRLTPPSADFEFAAAVAGFGMLLRESEHRGAITLDRILALAEDGRGPDPEGYRGDFVELVRAYRAIASNDP